MSPKRYLVLLKNETTQLTDAAPVAATNSMLVSNLTVTPLKTETQSRNLMRPYFGASESLVVMEEGTIEFDIEVAGSGTAGTAPAYGPALRACSWAETVTAATNVIYNPISAAQEAATIWAYRDGMVYKMVGAMGSAKLTMSAKKIPVYHFTFTGKYVAVSDVAMPTTSDFTAFKQPKASLPANTGTLTVDTYAAMCSAFSVDQGNEVSHAIWMNLESLGVTGREMKGAITVRAELIATKDYFSLLRAGTLIAIQVTHGVVGGNIVQFDAPKAQITDIKESTFENTLAWDMSLVFTPNTGNDEFKITVK